MRTISIVSSVRTPGTPLPVADPASPSGYEYGQHRLILPATGTDGYHWVMQAEAMLAGDGVRIRRTGVDNAPDGREVHWSSPPRWWLGVMARAGAAAVPGAGGARMLEQAAPLAGPLLLGLFLLLAAPLMARWFGALPAALGTLAWVGVFPLYEASAAGIVDHHAMAAMAGLAGLLLMAAGGAGRVRLPSPDGGAMHAGAATDREGGWWRLPLPEARAAHRRFAAAGVALAAGLWVSASTTLPLLAGIGVAGLLLASAAAPATGTERHAPEVWRTWGAAGCMAALVAWLVEYAPAGSGMRLEVNHPLYAFAWLAGGDLLARLGVARGRGVALLAGGAAMVRTAAAVLVLAAPLLAVLLGGSAVFVLADPLLRGIHGELIREFQPLHRHLAGASAVQAIQSVSLLPLILVPALAALPALHRRRPTLLLVTVPAALLTMLALFQVRWLGMASAALAALLVVGTAILGRHVQATAAPAALRRTLVAGALAILLPFPALAMLFPWRFGYPAPSEVPQVAARDLAHRLRAELGGAPLILVAPPTTSTWMAWFGGIPVVATLYWENRDGLAAWEAIRGAADAGMARALLDERRATHLLLPEWEPAPLRWLADDAPAWLVPVDPRPMHGTAAGGAAEVRALALPGYRLFRIMPAGGGDEWHTAGTGATSGETGG
jgi:hypothetical protein